MNIETGAKLSETISTVQEFGTSHDEWTMTKEEKRRRREATQWQSAIIFERAHERAMTKLEREQMIVVSQNKAVFVHETFATTPVQWRRFDALDSTRCSWRVEAWNCLDKNQFAELTSSCSFC